MLLKLCICSDLFSLILIVVYIFILGFNTLVGDFFYSLFIFYFYFFNSVAFMSPSRSLRFYFSPCNSYALMDLYQQAPEAPDEDVDGISQDQVPKPVSNAVRMDLHGGFVLQKINNNCNFFR